MGESETTGGGNPEETVTIAVFGEVLFDVFSGGTEVLGGAPFNVAWNLQGLGWKPLLVTRVGEDERGRRILVAMEKWGMDTRAVEIDPHRATGVVEVHLESGEPRFDILADRAYDAIEGRAALEILKSEPARVLYHGTLALRAEPSRNALRKIARATGLERFVDLNLRPPWWGPEIVREAVNGASWVKLNEAELASVGGVKSYENREDGLHAEARRLLDAWGLEYLVVTRAEKGALLFLRDGRLVEVPAPQPPELKDTVGAGDALSAVLLGGLISGWPPEVALKRGVEFAARVCGLRGAVTEERSFYEEARRAWGDGGG